MNTVGNVVTTLHEKAEAAIVQVFPPLSVNAKVALCANHWNVAVIETGGAIGVAYIMVVNAVVERAEITGRNRIWTVTGATQTEPL